MKSPFVEFDVRDRILIVGSGASGLAAAYELRRQGFLGELVVMGDEPEGHYDRPACSKGILTGHKRPSDVITPLDPDLDVIWRLGRRAVSCDLNRRVVEAHTGEMIFFDGLVIAGGCRPVVPNDWPDDHPGMHILHGLPAAWELRRELRTAKRVAVVGGGVTGCEVACAVKDLAREAVIVEPRPFVMGRAVGSIVGHMIAASHRRSGIELATGGRVSSVDVRKGRWELTLKDGSTVEADLVVASMGERPDVSWLEGTGIDISDGVLCDESLRVMTTTGQAVEGVVACGSLARWPNPRGNGTPARCGQWIAAQEQGQGAARTLLAGGRPVAAVPILPRYWTYQLGLRIEVCGELDPKADIDVQEMRPGKKDVAKAGVLATYTRNGKLIGSVAVNAPRLFTDTARIMRLDEPSVTVIPAMPAPVSPGVGPLEAPPVRLAIGAAPEPPPGPDPMYDPGYDSGYREPANLPEPAYKYPAYDPAYAYAPAGYAPRSDAGYVPGHPYSGAPAYPPRNAPGHYSEFGPTGHGYGPASYERGYERFDQGYESAGYEPKQHHRGYDPGGHVPAYDRGGYDRGGYDRGGYDQGRSDQGRSDQGRSDQRGYDQRSYDRGGYERAGYGPAYEPQAYEQTAYDPADDPNYNPGYEPPRYDRGDGPTSGPGYEPPRYDRGYGPTSGPGYERGGYEQGGGYERGGPGRDYRPAYDERAYDGRGQDGYGGSRHHQNGYEADQGGYDRRLPVQREPTLREQGFGPNPNEVGPHAGTGYGPTSGPGYGSGSRPGSRHQDAYWQPSLTSVA